MKRTNVDPRLRLLANEELARLGVAHPLSMHPSLEWRTYRVTAGRAHLRLALITLSDNLCIDGVRIRSVLRHEYAHFMVYDRFGLFVRPHGREWIEAMQRLGEPPVVRHSFEVTRNTKRTVAVYRCDRCSLDFSLGKRLGRGVRYTHIDCGGTLRFIGHSSLDHR